MAMKGRVLVIAGSDPSGGAGIQADIKTITAHGGYAAAVITALTVQNTTGVSVVQQISASFICDQINAVMSDIGADVIKIGMIGDAEAAHEIAKILSPFAGSIPIILDPVLVASSGDALAGEGMVDVLKSALLPLSAVVTPNAEEAARITNLQVKTSEDLEKAGKSLCEMGAGAALVKGGHLVGDEVTDILMADGAAIMFKNPRFQSNSTHGTGCTLASALAVQLAQGASLELAVSKAIDYVREAIKTAPGFGNGPGPLNHAHPVDRD